jgi:hypothetical protein
MDHDTSYKIPSVQASIFHLLNITTTHRYKFSSLPPIIAHTQLMAKEANLLHADPKSLLPSSTAISGTVFVLEA